MYVVGGSAYAYDLIDGICYNTNFETKTAEVISYGYSGDIVIPSTITYFDHIYSVTTIGSYAFQGCTGLTSITIPNSVTRIGGQAFYGCTGLTSIDIPNSVTSIGQSAFANCTGLTNITIPNSITSIEQSTFENCTGLTSITIPNSVTSIGTHALDGCTGLSSITIPNSVTSIGNYAFYGCTGLTSITLGNSVTGIGEWAFSHCTGLTSITIPNSVTSIEKSTFYSCTGLTSIIIPNSVTRIGERAFYGCTGLTSITIPNSVTAIGSSAFYGCTSLTSITIPNSVTTIGNYAFQGCTGLTRADYSSMEYLCSISFGSVESNPLYNARHLYINGEEIKDNLILPENITSIGAYAFNGCLLKNVMLKHQAPPTVSANTFSEPTRYHATLYVPVGMWESYAYDDGWYTFINIRETATEEAQLANTLSYTLMDAKTFSYLVYDPVNNGISTISSVGIDENNPNHSWQTLSIDGKRYLYNLGAKKFAASSADGKGLVLSEMAVSLSMQDGNDGLVFGSQTDKQWALVVNEKMTTDNDAHEAVTTAIALINGSTDKSASVSYGLDGRRLDAPQRGLNIIRMSDGTVRKVMVK